MTWTDGSNITTRSLAHRTKPLATALRGLKVVVLRTMAYCSNAPRGVSLEMNSRVSLMLQRLLGFSSDAGYHTVRLESANNEARDRDASNATWCPLVSKVARFGFAAVAPRWRPPGRVAERPPPAIIGNAVCLVSE